MRRFSSSPMLPYFRSSFSTLLQRDSPAESKAGPEPANTAEDPGSGGSGGATKPASCRDDTVVDDYEDGNLATDATSPVGETEARPSKPVPMSLWAAKRVRRILAPAGLGARFGAKGTTASCPAVADAQTQTLPDDGIEDTQCRRCRRVYRRQRPRDGDLLPLDKTPWPPPPPSTVMECPVKPGGGHYSGRVAEAVAILVAELLQYPWGADALLLVSIVLLASLMVILYYVVAVVLPIVVLAVLLAMLNSALFESSRFSHILQRLRLT
uniref:Putative conserved protein with signal anchor n=1 Tax=Amblyomma aureolatum TaxID=187763 RepID=A0A1E1XE98_9ACAR